MDDQEGDDYSLDYIGFQLNNKKKRLLRAFLDNRGVTIKDFFTIFVDCSLRVFEQQGLWDRGPYTIDVNGKRLYTWEGSERLRKFEERQKHKKK
jgi:hypothetical protein